MTAKLEGATLVSDGIWRFSRNINYFGDLMRYLSFSVVAGSIWAYIVPSAIALLYLQRISQKEQTMQITSNLVADTIDSVYLVNGIFRQ